MGFLADPRKQTEGMGSRLAKQASEREGEIEQIKATIKSDRFPGETTYAKEPQKW